MTAVGRLLPFTNATFWFGERPLVGESGHWDASSKSHVYDIRERQQRVGSGHNSPMHAEGIRSAQTLLRCLHTAYTRHILRSKEA